jgi:hypothetical protein
MYLQIQNKPQEKIELTKIVLSIKYKEIGYWFIGNWELVYSCIGILVYSDSTILVNFVQLCTMLDGSSI